MKSVAWNTWVLGAARVLPKYKMEGRVYEQSQGLP